MALNGKQITVAGQPSDPAILNKWLLNNQGYVDGDDLDEVVVPSINPQRIAWDGFYYNRTDFAPSQIKSLLINGKTIVIINVMKGEHFVLVVGYDDSDTTFYVNDPGFNKLYYLYSDIVGYRIFSMYGK